MSRRKSPDPLGSNTRQMLDELDSLMEKMLALPVNQLEDSATATSTTAPVAVQAPREPRLATPVRAEAMPAATSGQVLVAQIAVVHSPATHDVLPSPKSTRDSWAEYQPSNQDEVLPPLASLVAPVAETNPSASRLFLFRFRPLLWLNQGFDQLTQRLGFAGSWLRSSRGRMVIGVVGLTLLALAAGWWLKEWLGWTWSWDSLESM
jgi:hypothetical protein